MRFARAAQGSVDAVSQLVGGQETVGLNHLALAVNPFGFDGIEPGALGRQLAAEEPHALASRFDLLIMGADPGAHGATDVPGGVVPDQQQRRRAVCRQPVTAPGEELRGDGAERTVLDTAQQGSLAPLASVVPGAQQQPIAGQGLGIRVVARDRLLDQAQGLVVRPGVAGGLGYPTPPTLIRKAQGPGRMRPRQTDQAVALTFFRAYSGSGLVIQRLARSQCSPAWARTARIVSPVTRRGVIPWRAASSAAIANVQTLLS